METSVQRDVTIAGTGGVGFYLSILLSRMGITHSVFDADDMRGGMGHRRMPAFCEATTKKVDLLRGFTIVSMGDTAPVAYARKFTEGDPVAGSLIVDCTDMPLEPRKQLWKRIRESHPDARLLRVSYDGATNCVVVAEGLPLAARPDGGYSAIPTLALSFVAAGMGATAVKQILDGHEGRIEFQVSLDELIKGEYQFVKQAA